MPFAHENIGWAARAFPWESVIDLATKPFRKERPLTVVRRLIRGERAQLAPTPATPSSLLLVCSAPGRIVHFYEFESECALVRGAFGDQASTNSIKELRNPSLQGLTQAVAESKPEIIHLSGVDVHQAQELDPAIEQSENDGFILSTANGGYEVVAPTPLATALTSGGHRPLFVAINWESGRFRGVKPLSWLALEGGNRDTSAGRCSPTLRRARGFVSAG